MWVSIKTFQFLNFNGAFEQLERGTMIMAFPRRHIFHTHTYLTDPPIVASHYFKEDFNSRTKQKSLKISRYVIAQFGVCDCDIDTSALKTKKVFSGKYQHKNQCFFKDPCLATPVAPNLQASQAFILLLPSVAPNLQFIETKLIPSQACKLLKYLFLFLYIRCEFSMFPIEIYNSNFKFM